MLNQRLKVPAVFESVFAKVNAVRESREEQVRWEDVIVFDDDIQTIYRASMPVTELDATLGRTARFQADTTAPRYIGAGICMGILWVVIGLVLFLMTRSLMFAAISSVFLAWPGGGVGWIIGPRFGPRPQWLCRKIEGEIVLLNTEAYMSTEHPEASFVAEMMGMRDMRFLLSGGHSKREKLVLTSLLVMMGCLIFALFFFIIVFSGSS
jgi:hypothetical protein